MAEDGKLDNVKDALKADLEQTKADLPGLHGKELDQDADDTVKQALGKETPPPTGANPT